MTSQCFELQVLSRRPAPRPSVQRTAAGVSSSHGCHRYSLSHRSVQSSCAPPVAETVSIKVKLVRAMSGYLACNVVAHILLPVSLIVACCLQFDILSVLYVLLLFVAPSVPLAGRRHVPEQLRRYLIGCLAVTVCIVLPALVFQLVLVAFPSIATLLSNNETVETLLRHFGLVNLGDASKLTVIFCAVSRLLPVLVAVVALRECRSVRRLQSADFSGHTSQSLLGDVSRPQPTLSQLSWYNNLVPCCVLVCLVGAAVLHPCLPGAVYLLVLLALMTWWAYGRTMARRAAVACRLLMAAIVVHLLALYSYQLQYIQQLLPADSLATRLSGLVAYRLTEPDRPGDIKYATLTVDTYLYPLAVYLLFYFLCLESRRLLTCQPFVRTSAATNYGAIQFSGTSDNAGDLRLRSGDTASATVSVGGGGGGGGGCGSGSISRWSYPLSLLMACWSAASRASFLVTYVVMMYWSIKYHSWPTLVFLVWALVVAVARSQRQLLHRSAPLLVLYAQLLLLTQYVFCLPLTVDELPETVGGFAMRDLFIRPARFPCTTLALQLSFICVFWVTLRQYVQERRSLRASVSLYSANDGRRVSLQDGWLKRCSAALMALVIRLWIVLLAVLLFVYGGGQSDTVTIFQIVYMAFFLFFVCLFQVSFRLWRRMLYGFVTCLIVYQMLVLVSIYLYQFVQVRDWLSHVGVSEQWQQNIGLSAYSTGRLFVNLLFPTVFMVVCVIYAQHVHERFLAVTDIDTPSSLPAHTAPRTALVEPESVEVSLAVCDSSTSAAAARAAAAAAAPHCKAASRGSPLATFGNCALRRVAAVWRQVSLLLHSVVWLAARLLEIHSMKVNVLALVLVALLDVCATHTVLVLCACVLLQLGRRGQQLLCSLVLGWIAVLVMLRVVYQLKIVAAPLLIVNCSQTVVLTVAEVNTNGISAGAVLNTTPSAPVTAQYRTTENATDALLWLGVEKRAQLLNYLTGYIAVLVVFTVHKCVRVHWSFVRRRAAGPGVTAGGAASGAADGAAGDDGTVFSGVTRREADNGLVTMLQYLINYGFYKFGVEVCLIALVTVIGSRLDVVALLYAVWLCGLFSLRRATLARFWPLFVAFVATLICLQYLASLGLPPALCIDYPYIGRISDYLRVWLFLPDYRIPLHSDRLFADTLLLVLAYCQKRVFVVEAGSCSSNSNNNNSCGGGSNQPVTEQQLAHCYVNPVPDFNVSNGCYLNVLKRALFFSSFWITLALVCLAGINRVTLLSLLYVVGAFVFLWMGNDFYLLPLDLIRQRWQLLLTYNVIAISLKSTALHLIGFLFESFFCQKALWLVQLLGTGCFRDSGSTMVGEETDVSLDGIVFVCLILQHRFYSSHYFQHLVEETRAQQLLANCGAELIRIELQKKICKRRAQEERAMADIQSKMERIKEQRLDRNRHKHNHYSGSALHVIHSCAAEDLQMDLEREFMRRQSMPPATPLPAATAAAAEAVDSENTLSPGQVLLAGLTTDLSGGSRARRASAAYRRQRRAKSMMERDRVPTHCTERSGSVEPVSSCPARSHLSPVHSVGEEEGAVVLSHSPSGRAAAATAAAATSSSSQETAGSDMDDTTTSGELSDSHSCQQHRRRKCMARSWWRSARLGARLAVQIVINLIIALTVYMNRVSEDYRSIARQLSRKKRHLKEVWRRQRVSSSSLFDDTLTSVHTGSSATTGTRDSHTTGDATTAAAAAAAAAAGSSSSSSSSLPSATGVQCSGTSVGRAQSADDDTPAGAAADDDEAAFAVAGERTQLLDPTVRDTVLPTASTTIIVPIPSSGSSGGGSSKSVTTPAATVRPAASDSLLEMTGHHSSTSLPQQQQQQQLEQLEEQQQPEQLEEDTRCPMPTVEQLSAASARQIAEQLMVACWYAIVSRSELLAYIVVFVNQMNSASILSLPLPLMVFLWGSLSVPRPSKTFWITMLAYLEAIIIIKYMFQFKFFPQNQIAKANAPFWAPRIIGIEEKENYALYDLILLLVIFFHRMVLKSLGLWKNADHVSVTASSSSGEDDSGSMLHQQQHQQQQVEEQQLVIPTAAESEQQLQLSSEQQQLAEPALNATERGVQLADRVKSQLAESLKFYMSAVSNFFEALLSETYKNKVDVYAYMFLCDFINIFIVFMGFSSFGPPQGAGGGDISSVVAENKVPLPFLIILSLNFLLILLDRGIYLRKSIGWKTVFQYMLVVLIHGWLFFILPAMTGREFQHALAPRIWYMIKCVYLLFSAHQIRNGYPTRILGNFLTKHYTSVNKFAFRGFMLIPFLYELRALMDWLWTKTSLDVFNWVKMEDIYAHIFISKCQRVQEESEVYVSGEPRRASEKCMFGGCWLLMIITVIFAPLVLFALNSAVGLPNPPSTVELELSIATYEPLFRIKTNQNGIKPLDLESWNAVLFHYRSDRNAQGFLTDFHHQDVTVISLSGQSTAVWAISPPAQEQMIADLQSDLNISLALTWSVRRMHDSAGVSLEATGAKQLDLLPFLADGERNPVRTQLAAMLNGTADSSSNVTLTSIFPKFLRITNRGTAEVPPGLEDPEGPRTEGGTSSEFRNLTIRLIRNQDTKKQWWQLSEDFSDGLYKWIAPAQSFATFLTILGFSQRAFPSTLSFFTGAGIIGTYTTFVLVIGRLCRSSFVDVSFHIMFDDMPYVDRILQICEDIYLVRERGNLVLEEELFAKLIFLYRSPEMLIKYTEPPPSVEQMALPSVSPEVRRRLQSVSQRGRPSSGSDDSD